MAGREAEVRERRSLLAVGRTAVASMQDAVAPQFQNASAKPDAQAAPVARQILNRLQQANPDCHSFVLLAYSGGEVKALADSANGGGYVDEDTALHFQKVFESGQEEVGSARDGVRSHLVSAWIPVRALDSGRVVAVLRVNQDYEYAIQEIRHRRIPPILITMLLTLLVVGFFTAEKRNTIAREALRRSEQSLRHVFDHVDDAVLVHDAQGMIIDVNQRMTSLYQVTQEEALQMAMDRDLSGCDCSKERLQEMWREALEGRTLQFEWRARRPKDGGEFDVEMSLSRMNVGERNVVVATVRDITSRKRTELEIRRQHASMQAIVSALDDIVVEADTEGRLINAWVGRLATMMDSSEEAAGKTLADMFGKELEPRMISLITEALRRGEPSEMEYPILLEGHQRWYNARFCPLPRPGEKLGRVSIRISDITDRKRAEMAERQRAKEMETLLDSLPGYAFFKDRHGIYITANERFCSAVNVTRDLIAGKTDFDLFARDVSEKYRAEDARLLSGSDSMLEMEETMVVDGQKCTMSTRRVAVRDSNGEIGGLIGLTFDITARKQAEQALADERNFARIVMEHMGQGLAVTGTDGTFDYVNPTFAFMLGCLPIELADKRLEDYILPDDYADLLKAGMFREEKAGCTRETRLRRRDGNLVPVLLSRAPHIHGGQLDGWVSVITDLTEQKRTQEQLQRSKAELEQANRELRQAIGLANELAARAEAASRAKSDFLANMSHEIRTPMNGVIGMTGLLLDSQLTTEQREYAEIVRRSGETLLGIINDILDFSKIEAGKLEMETIDFDLRQTLEEAGDMLALRAEEKNLEFICIVDADAPAYIQGDPGRLRQVLINLVSNAIKFTDEGEVSIRVSREMETETEVRLRFEVRDTGIGIPHEKLTHLFNPFTQVDASTTRRYGGTGLGLSIAKRLVELMQGEIGVESEQGSGSKFWFSVVFGRIHSAAPREERLPSLLGRRILVVDDNATNRRLMEALLESWGCKHEEAGDPLKVIELMRNARAAGNPFEVVILDMHMPGIDGEQLGRLIKSDPDLRNTRMLMLGSIGHRDDLGRLKNIGIEVYLTKPVRQSQLRECLINVFAPLTPPKSKPGSGAPGTSGAPAQTPMSKVRILLVEDNITNQKVALAILQKLGYRADAVANGREAVRALESIPYDLVLMDCQMPTMDGYEASRRIRDPQSPVLNHQVPIIAMTAHALKGSREECLAAGMNDYISKPVQPRVLAGMLSRWLDHGDAPRNPAEEKKEMSTVVFDKDDFVGRVMGEMDLARNILEEFLRDIPSQFAALKEALESGDCAEIRRRAHSIKGVTATVSAPVLREISARMEQCALASDLQGCKSGYQELELALHPVIQAVDVFLKTA
jgi:PAS domain S-box-containing protein